MRAAIPSIIPTLWRSSSHHVEGSVFPENLGKDFVRGFTLVDDTPTLRFTSPADDGAVTRTLDISGGQSRTG
jgi:hypothetical protein